MHELQATRPPQLHRLNVTYAYADFYKQNGLEQPTPAQLTQAAQRDGQLRANLNAATKAALAVSASVALGGLSPSLLQWALSNPIAASQAGIISAETAAIVSGAITPSGLLQQVGNLNIESLQGTSTYTSEQGSAGAGASLCLPPLCYGSSSVSVSASQSNIDSRFASVGQQSGLKAGDGGFQVAVNNHTDLKGAVIASTQTAIDNNKNTFTTGGQLTTSDIQNKADYKGDGYAISASLGFKAGDQSAASTDAQKAAANAQPTNSGSVGIGRDKGSASSTTTSGISGIAGNTAVRAGDAQTGIQKIFDTAKVHKEIDAQVQIMQSFGKEASTAIGTYAKTQLAQAETKQTEGQIKQQQADKARSEDRLDDATVPRMRFSMACKCSRLDFLLLRFVLESA